jgi:hypothetical protein
VLCARLDCEKLRAEGDAHRYENEPVVEPEALKDEGDALGTARRVPALRLFFFTCPSSFE